MGFPFRFVLAAAIVTTGVGCKGDAKKEEANNAPKPAEKIPEDFVMNEFFKEGKKFKPILSDAGLDASFLTGPSGEGGAPAGMVEDTAIAERGVRVTNPGEAPKVARRYNIKGGPEERRLSINAQISTEMDGQRQGADQPPITAQLVFTGKPDKGEDRLEVVLKKLSVNTPPNADKRQQAAQDAALKELSGLTVGMRITPRGSLGEPEFKEEKMPRAAQQIIPILAQAFEIVTVPFPEEPIGVGAVWEETQKQKEQGALEVVTHMTFTLREVKGDVLKVEAEIKRESKKVEVRAQGAPPGTTLQITGTGKYVYETKLTGVATKVDGELTTIRAVEIPAQGKKMKQVETAKVKHAIDTQKL
jgi:hypothetical protein